MKKNRWMNADCYFKVSPPVIHIVKICCKFAIICHSLSQCSRLSAVTSACATLFTFLDILADSEELLSGEELSAVIWKRSLWTLWSNVLALYVQGYCTAVHSSLSAPYLSSALVLMWYSQEEYRWMSMKPYPPDISEEAGYCTVRALGEVIIWVLPA